MVPRCSSAVTPVSRWAEEKRENKREWPASERCCWVWLAGEDDGTEGVSCVYVGGYQPMYEAWAPEKNTTETVSTFFRGGGVLFSKNPLGIFSCPGKIRRQPVAM